MKEISEFKDASIDGKNIILVPFTKNHLHNPMYIRWLRDYGTVRYINRPEYLTPIPFENVVAYVTHMRESKNDLFFAIETIPSRVFIGTFKIGFIDWYHKFVNLGILIGDKNFWGKGIATEAFSIAIDYCFNALDMHKIVVGCMEANIGMRKVFEKLGFKEEGRFREQDFFEGKYSDHFHYGLLRGEYFSGKK